MHLVHNLSDRKPLAANSDQSYFKRSSFLRGKTICCIQLILILMQYVIHFLVCMFIKMEGFSNLLTDAFSETSVTSFPDEDLDFENLSYDEKNEEDKTADLTTKTDGALFQEATAETTALLGKATKDISYMADDVSEEVNNDESSGEEFEGADLQGKIPQDDYTSSDGESDQEGSVSGEDEEEDLGTAEEPGDLLRPACCSDELHDSDKEDRIFVERQPIAPQGADNPQVRNKVQGEAECDEEMAYFFPKSGSEIVIKGAVTEDKQESEEDSSDSESEGMKIKEGQNVVSQETGDLCIEDSTKAAPEFPCISMQNLQDLIAEVDGEEYEEKMVDFSGEEHQEAGESYAEYPSDFSSSEYAEDRGIIPENKPETLPCMRQNEHLERGMTATPPMGYTEDTDDEKKDGFLYSKDLELNTNEMVSMDVGPGGPADVKSEHFLSYEPGQSDSDSSSDYEGSLRINPEETMAEPENNKEPEELYAGGRASFSSWSDSHNCHITNDRADLADFTSWDFDVLKSGSLLSEYLLTTEDTEETEVPPSGLNRSYSDDVNSNSAAKRGDTKMTSPSNQGSLDDSFFFNTDHEATVITELGQLADDEYEEERNWEREQERIKAFYKFYDDSDEDNGREGRQIKVQFCADPLSQVICYETESSDRESLSSSTDREEDPSSAGIFDELMEVENTPQIKPVAQAFTPPNIQVPEKLPDASNIQTCSGRNKCLGMLKLIVTTGILVVMGLLMFWLTTDQMDWLRHPFFS